MSILKDWNSTTPETGFTRANGQFCCPYSITTVKSPDGAAGNVLRFELNNTDALVSSSKRAELQLSPDVDTQKQKTFYGLDYWFEKYDSDGGAESILQWHDEDDTTPPLSIQVSGGRMNLCQSFATGNLHFDMGPTTIGKWVRIILAVDWKEDNTGSVEVWRDGVKVVSRLNVRTNSKGGSYLKYGINKWSWASGGGSSSVIKRVFYTNNFRIGTTIEDVTPGTVIIPPANIPPVVNAGPDQTIKIDTVLLSGQVSDPDGTIASVLWAGPGIISKPNVAATSVTGLPAGVYTFTLTATDNKGASASDTVQVTVLAPDPVPVVPRKITRIIATFDDGGTQTL